MSETIKETIERLQKETLREIKTFSTRIAGLKTRRAKVIWLDERGIKKRRTEISANYSFPRPDQPGWTKYKEDLDD